MNKPDTIAELVAVIKDLTTVVKDLQERVISLEAKAGLLK